MPLFILGHGVPRKEGHCIGPNFIPTKKIVESVRTVFPHSRPWITSCHSGQACLDCVGQCIGAGCAKDQLVGVLYTEDTETTTDMLADLLCDEKLFLKYSDGKCEIGNAGLRKLWEERYAFELGVYEDNLIYKTDKASPERSEKTKKEWDKFEQEVRQRYKGKEVEITREEKSGGTLDVCRIHVKARYFVNDVPSRYVYLSGVANPWVLTCL